jgi:hypothetical protein
MKSEAAGAAEAFNPYAPPAARLDDAASAGQGPVFFPVSTAKLALMSVFTLGLYEIYWFYKNWKLLQQNFGANVNAPIRAVFYPLISYPLFKRVREHAATLGVEGSLPAGALAIVVFLFALVWQLPGGWGMLGLLGVAPLLLVQRTVNRINRKVAPQADANSRLSGWNVVGLVVGTILLALAFIGAFFGE